MGEEKKVDFYTTSRDMDSVMLSEYPGTIFEHQYKADASNPEQKVYGFLDLNYNELLKFITRYFEEYEFEIKEKDGKVLIRSEKEGRAFKLGDSNQINIAS